MTKQMPTAAQAIALVLEDLDFDMTQGTIVVNQVASGEGHVFLICLIDGNTGRHVVFRVSGPDYENVDEVPRDVRFVSHPHDADTVE